VTRHLTNADRHRTNSDDRLNDAATLTRRRATVAHPACRSSWIAVDWERGGVAFSGAAISVTTYGGIEMCDLD
jgi:hypothetical protein